MSDTLMPPPAPPPPRPLEPVDSISFVREVERCRKGRLHDVIENTSFGHAAVITKNLLILAAEDQSEIRIVSGALTSDFYVPLIPDIDLAMRSGCPVRIIVLSDESRLRGNAFYDFIKRKTSGSIICLPRPNENTVHFFVTDNAYRVEVDDKSKKAYASFNDEGSVLTKILDDKFEHLWKQGMGPNAEHRSIGTD